MEKFHSNSQVWLVTCRVPLASLLLLILVSSEVVVAADVEGVVLVHTKDNFNKEVHQEQSAFASFYSSSITLRSLEKTLKRIKSLFSLERYKGSRMAEAVFESVNFEGVEVPSSDSQERSIVEIPNRAVQKELLDNDQPEGDLKLETIPSNVVVLTDDNFDEVVLDETKHVMVDFYAPWCYWSKQLAPTYEKLAETYKSEDDVVIANLDATKYVNLRSKYNISGYPTLRLFTKRNKDGEDYYWNRELDDLVSFIDGKRNGGVLTSLPPNREVVLASPNPNFVI